MKELIKEVNGKNLGKWILYGVLIVISSALIFMGIAWLGGKMGLSPDYRGDGKPPQEIQKNEVVLSRPTDTGAVAETTTTTRKTNLLSPMEAMRQVRNEMTREEVTQMNQYCNRSRECIAEVLECRAVESGLLEEEAGRDCRAVLDMVKDGNYQGREPGGAVIVEEDIAAARSNPDNFNDNKPTVDIALGNGFIRLTANVDTNVLGLAANSGSCNLSYSDSNLNSFDHMQFLGAKVNIPIMQGKYADIRTECLANTIRRVDIKTNAGSFYAEF